MRLFILGMILIFSTNCMAQQRLNCSGLESIQVTLKANLAGRQQDKYISKSELSKADLKIYFENSTLKIFGFVASYDCHSGIQYDVNTKEYIGNKILAGDSFLEGIQVGDLFMLDCLVLEKNGKKFTTAGISFEVVD